MKKIFLIMLLLVCLVLCSCGTEMQTEEDVSGNNGINYSMFILVEDNVSIGYKIVYHRDTKVMYAISDGSYNRGTFTVLLSPNGTPMLWESGDEVYLKSIAESEGENNGN